MENQRAILEEFYRSTNGDKWYRNEKWCTDKPLGEWKDVTTDGDGNVKRLNLDSNQLSGPIPETFGQLSQLTGLYLRSNQLSGPIPETLGQLSQLTALDLRSNQLSGRFPNSSEGWRPNIEVDVSNNPDFDSSYAPFKQSIGQLNRNNVVTLSGILTIFISLVFAYVDLGTDVYSATIFYDSGQYRYFGLQLFFFLFPMALLAYFETGGIWDRIYILTQIRLAVEVYRSLKGHKETNQFLTMKIFEAIMEAVPSALLQLVVVFTDTKHMNSSTSLSLLLSTSVSIVAIAMVLYRYFEPMEVFEEKLSRVLRLVYHFTEIWFRLATFVAIFIAVENYGFILLCVSILWRGFIVFLDNDFNVNFKMASDMFTLSISECLMEGFVFEQGLAKDSVDNFFMTLSLHICSAIDYIISISILFTVGDDIVPDSRKFLILYIGLASFLLKTILVLDRNSESRPINNAAVSIERPLEKWFGDATTVGETYIQQLCCFAVCVGVSSTLGAAVVVPMEEVLPAAIGDV